MDNYEKLLTEKIENAKKSIESAEREFRFGITNEQIYLQIKQGLYNEIQAYQDALNLYKNLKAKREI